MHTRRYDLREMKPARIGILRALKLGDMLCSIPAVRALKRAVPHTEISLIGLPWAREFAERFSHYFSEFVEFPGWPGLPEQEMRLDEVPGFLTHARQRAFDLLVQMHGSGRHVNDAVGIMGARQVAGFCEDGPAWSVANTFITYPDREPEVWKCLRLACHIGGVFDGEDLEFPLWERDFERVERLVPESFKRGPFAVLHPGALANRERLWPLADFAEVGRTLTTWGISVVITGSHYEKSRADQLLTLIQAQIGNEERLLNLCGKTSLGSLGALLSQSRLLVCHDTGVSHMAAALRVPSVVLFDRSDREGWPPADRQLHRFMTRFDPIRPHHVVAEIDDLLRSTEGRLTSRLHDSTTREEPCRRAIA